MAKLPWSSKQEQGATLVELVMTIVIISVAIAGVVGAFSLIVGRSADPLNQVRATALAQLYYDELASIYYDPDTKLGGGRVDVGGVTCDQLALEPVIDVPAKYQYFEANFDIACAGDEAAFDSLGLEHEDIKKISITITDPTGQEYVFSAYRGNF